MGIDGSTTEYRGRLPFHVTLILSCFLGVGLASAEGLRPSTEYQPQDVISIIIDALYEKDPADHDKGIATVFRFASPENRQQTGPLPRFASMLKSSYGDMLNHLASRRDPIEIDNGVALQAVWLITTAGGSETGYMFKLSKQTDGEFAGMWMTDAVYPLGPGKYGRAI